MAFEPFGDRFLFAPASSGELSLSIPSDVDLPEVLATSLVDLSLSIVRESRGPMRLWDFARRLESRLGMPRTPTGELCNAVKAALERINDPRVAVLATSMPGVGYVYDANDPDAKPIRASR